MVGYQEALKQNESLAEHRLAKERSIVAQAASANSGRYFGDETATGKGVGLKGWLTGPGLKDKERSLHSAECLVLFESAVEATRCAIEIQRALREYNREASASKDVQVRIAIHSGEVTITDGELSGEAVAVASKIAQLAEPEAILVSDRVFDQVKTQITQPLLKVVQKDPKNVRFPVEAYKILLLPEESPTVDQAPETSMGPRLAVLPFVNMSPDSQDEFFSDGLTEEMITELSGLDGLGVIARTSVMQYKTTGKNIREIASDLRVGYVLEGSVRKAGNKIRITVQLIDAKYDSHLWTQRFDRDLDDIFAIQTEVAEKVAGALTVKFLAEKSHRDTSDMAAYTIFMRANQLLQQKTESSLREALSLYTQATARDPGFARAYAGIAQAWYNLGASGFEDFGLMIKEGERAAMKSIELGPDEAETHAAMATIYLAEDKFESLRSELRKALLLNRNLVDAHCTLAEVQVSLEGLDAAVKSYETAHELDPMSIGVAMHLARTYQMAGRTAPALEILQRLLLLHPTSPLSQIGLAKYYTWSGDFAKAQESIDAAAKLGADESSLKLSQGMLYAVSGRRKEAEEVIGYFNGLNGESARLLGIFPIASALGDLDLAFKCLMRMADLHSWDSAIRYNYNYSSLRRDPRYRVFCKKVGIPP